MGLCNSKRAIFCFGVLCLLASPAWSEDALDHWYFRDTRQLSRVRFVGGMFIGLGANGQLATSEDGKNWILRNTGTTASLRGVAYGKVSATPPLFLDRLFVAVGGGATILKSYDGTNWTQVVTTNTCDLNDVAASSWPATFVAVATRKREQEPDVLRSLDGVAWTPVNFCNMYETQTRCIAASGGAFVAGSTHGCEPFFALWRSSNGTTWRNVSNPYQFVSGIVYGGERFLLVGWENEPMMSTDLGLSWFYVGWNFSPPYDAGNDVAYGNGTFVIARYWRRDGLLTTTDCQTWNKRPVLAGLSMSSVAFGNGTFVAVGSDGIYQSEPVATPILSARRPANSNAIELSISGEMGRRYHLQTSTLSSAWSDYRIYTNASGTTTLVDPIAPSAASLFYRVISP